MSVLATARVMLEAEVGPGQQNFTQAEIRVHYAQARVAELQRRRHLQRTPSEVADWEASMESAQRRLKDAIDDHAEDARQRRRM